MLKKFSIRSLIIATVSSLFVIIGLFIYFYTSHQPAPRKPYYIIGRDNSWYPLELWGKEFNLIAFTNDLMAAISAVSNLQFRWAESGTLALVENLNKGLYDGILSSMRPSVLNRNDYLFSPLIFETGLVLVVEEGDPYHSLADMSGHVMGITAGYNFTFNAIHASGANAYDIILVNYPGSAQAFDALTNNQVDGILMGAQQAFAITNKLYINQLRVATPPLTDEGVRMISLNDASGETLISEFDEALHKLKEDGTYDALLSKWSLFDPDDLYKKQNPQEAP